MKDFLKKIIAAKEARANELREQIKKSEDVNEVRSLGSTLQGILDELTEAKAKLEEIENDGGEGDNGEGNGAQRSATIIKPVGGFNPMATYSARKSGAGVDNDMEKRLAFANFVTRGVMTEEMRATTNTTNTKYSNCCLL